MAAAATKYRPEEIALLGDEQWKSLIDRDLRTLTKKVRDITADDRELAAALRSPYCLDRYYFTLLRMLKNVEGTLAARREEMIEERNRLLAEGKVAEWRQAQANYASQRKSSLRFKSGLDQTFLEIKFLRSGLFEAKAETRLQRVLRIVQEHRDGFPEDDEPSEADLNLWRTIEG